MRATAVAVLLVLAGCATGPRATVLQGDGLGASWSVKLSGAAPHDVELVRRGIQARVDEVAHHMSRWDSQSSLSTINSASTDDWQVVPAGLLPPLTYAFALAAATGGAYDPTVAALVDVWGFGTSGRRYEPPSFDAVAAARERVGFGKVSVDVQGHRVRKPAALQIDLSSMTHGFAADRVAGFLDGSGVQNYLVEVGGEIRARGESPEGGAWRVEIEMPPAEISEGGAGARQDGGVLPDAEGSLKDASPPSAVAADGADGAGRGKRVVSLRDVGVATSGNYRYYFDYNGRRYSHRIDPRTGEPVAHSLASVTVIDPECMHADALATALTVLGPDEGFQYAKHRDIAALFILRDDNKLVERMTPRFAAYLN